ncbi:Rrf2 family transcriptional regulator [Acuticoccus sp. M5D2P5]|uniref:Rrf2 family transcriptional regulator n=1 Tax=Acuticoccus kalidii TaxID=2910977 RepID=UPI001F45C8FC|nr:Rrf2 family transcriptional regulator [Acuticoccus kalidii]MCF3935777.1 Rrf2 family transcriptional regulator [Acuticoccus kalidii]
MRLTEQTRHALRVLAECAARHPDLVQVSAIAQETQLTEYTIFKLLKTATRADLIVTVRGRNGGIRLARAPEKTTLGCVVRTFEPRFRDCAPAELLTVEAVESDVVDRNLNRALGHGFRAFLTALDQMTVLDLLQEETASTLDLPPARNLEADARTQ